MWIVRLALRRPYTIAVLSFVLLLMGALSVSRMPKDIFPAIDIPVVIVVWNYPGLLAEDMERRVVLISERAYSTTVNGISRIESQSIDGVGILRVYFLASVQTDNIGGQDNDGQQVRVESGLTEGQLVGLHIGDEVSDGARVEAVSAPETQSGGGHR